MTGSPYPPNPQRNPDEESTRKLVRRPTRGGLSGEISRSPDPSLHGHHPAGQPGAGGHAAYGRAETPGGSWSPVAPGFDPSAETLARRPAQPPGPTQRPAPANLPTSPQIPPPAPSNAWPRGAPSSDDQHTLYAPRPSASSQEAARVGNPDWPSSLAGAPAMPAGAEESQTIRAGPPPGAKPPPSTIPSSDINPVPASPSVSFEEARGFPSIPGYEVLEKIAEGGMGAVFRIRQKETGALRAAKTIKAGQADVEAIRRFRFEAEALAALNHPGICGIHAAGLTDGTPWFVMELIEGRELQELCDEPMEPRRAAAIVARISRAMAAAHAVEILHRDLKPQNVFLCADDEVRVADFGLARLQGGEGLTKTGDIIGTPAYMSPEQVIGKHDEVDERTDIWATGLILYRLLAGHSPWTQTNSIGVMSEIATGQLRSIEESRPGLEPELVAVLDRALRFDITERYSSAADLAEDLEAWLEDRTPRALALKSEEDQRARRRRLAILTVLITLAIASVIATGIVVQRARAAAAANKLADVLDRPSVEAQRRFVTILKDLKTAEQLRTGGEVLRTQLSVEFDPVEETFREFRSEHLESLGREHYPAFRTAAERLQLLQLTIDAFGKTPKVSEFRAFEAQLRAVETDAKGKPDDSKEARRAQRLRRTFIDLAWIHCLAGRYPIEDFLEALPRATVDETDGLDPNLRFRVFQAVCKPGGDRLPDKTLASHLGSALALGKPSADQRLAELEEVVSDEATRARVGRILLYVLNADLEAPGSAQRVPDRDAVFRLLSEWKVELDLALGRHELPTLATRAQASLDGIGAKLNELHAGLVRYLSEADQRATHQLADGGTLVETPRLTFVRPATLTAPVEFRAGFGELVRTLLPALRRLSVLQRHLKREGRSWELLRGGFEFELDRIVRHLDPPLAEELLSIADRVVGFRMTREIRDLRSGLDARRRVSIEGFRWRIALIRLDESITRDPKALKALLLGDVKPFESFLAGFDRSMLSKNEHQLLKFRIRTFAENVAAGLVRCELLEGRPAAARRELSRFKPPGIWSQHRVADSELRLSRALLFESRIAGPLLGGLDELEAMRGEILRLWREDQHCFLERPGGKTLPLDLWTETHLGNLWTPTWDQHHIGPLLIRLHLRRFEEGLPMTTTVPALDLSLMEASLNLYTTGKAVDEHLIRQARGHLELAELFDRLERPRKVLEHAGFALELSRGLGSRPLQAVATRARDLVQAREPARAGEGAGD